MANMHGVLGFAVLATATAAQFEDVSDQELLAMGRARWIARFTGTPDGAELLPGAESRYGVALTRRNEQTIETRLDREYLKDLQIYFANIGKGSCRLSDYLTYGTPTGPLFNRRAEVACAQALDGFLNNRETTDRFTQADVWRTFKEVREVHLKNGDLIEKHRRSFGGYTVERFPLEYGGVGYMIDRTIKHVADKPPSQKQHVFNLCYRMIRLTIGENPLP